MTEEELKQIRERCDEATEGPWGTYNGCAIKALAKFDGWKAPTIATVELLRKDYETHILNAEFIAHARTDIPKLLDEIEKLREALKYYSDRKVYVDPYYVEEEKNGKSPILVDGGDIARKALGEE